MKPRTIAVLWLIAAILGATIAFIKFREGNADQATTNRAPGQTLLENFPIEEISTIQIAGADSSVTLTKNEDSWTVAERDNYPANFSNIKELLFSLKDLEVTQGIEAGSSIAPRFGMDEDSPDPETRGLIATFKKASGEELAGITFGKSLEAATSSQYGGGITGRYVRNHADDSGFYAVSEPFGILSSAPKDWLKDTLIQIEKIQSISLTLPGSEKIDWEITRPEETTEFTFSEAYPGVKLDKTAANPLASVFSALRIDDLIPASDLEEIATPEKLQTAKVTTFEGFTYTITLQPKKDTDSYLITMEIDGQIPAERKKVDSEKKEETEQLDKAFSDRKKALTEHLEATRSLQGRTLEIQKFKVNPILKNRAALIDKTPAPDPQPTPVPLEKPLPEIPEPELPAN